MSNAKDVGLVDVECAHLTTFKNFLKSQIGNSEVFNGESTETAMRNCVTRGNNETYIIQTLEERNAVMIHTIWSQLQLKSCPRYFCVKLLHAAIKNLSSDSWKNAKECIVNSVAYGDMEIQYDLLKLQKYISNHLEKLLARLTDNTEAGHLKNYADAGILCSTAKNCVCLPSQDSAVYAIAQIKNKPRKMEDRNICLERYSEIYGLPAGYSFYGVFDGHSGALSASYAASQLPLLLAKRLQKFRTEHDMLDVDFYRDAFESAFLEADERFRGKRITSGSTAICALISEQRNKCHLYVAWVGDSKALLVGLKASLQLVKPHKPDAPDERKRIEAAGGSVLHTQGQWRVNGILNVARSIGDYTLEAVIAEPDFVDIQLNAAHDFLIMGSDGLFDHIDEGAMGAMIYAALADEKQKFENIPKLLVEAAKEGDSQDNITAIIVLLKTRAQIVEHYKKM